VQDYVLVEDSVEGKLLDELRKVRMRALITPCAFTVIGW
jgi:hypothetical protein